MIILLKESINSWECKSLNNEAQIKMLGVLRFRRDDLKQKKSEKVSLPGGDYIKQVWTYSHVEERLFRRWK